ncbi:alpha/beta hydrolase [Actinospica sp.]|uniref:alpha/beta hydrolase n=1 Tax=Actinospica sp. TaxID=1872142 RepID=UPI002C112F66|nr:alpha/beta hydrolase-fold protein [Actinospica sp.]HWG24889.1 alpha/beta hydrolase-fold protein [Actinospica sp.]
MSVPLTGNGLLAVLALLVLAALTGVVLLWRKLSGKTWRHVLGRIGVLGGAQLVLVLLLAAFCNDYFGFYSSWHDLLGFASQAVDQNQAHPLGPASGSDAPDGPGAPGQPHRALLTIQSISGLSLPSGTVPSATGETQDVTILGASTGLSTHAVVYLPPQYFQSAYRGYDFPAAIVSTGYPGDITGLEDRLKYPYRLLTGINSRQDKPVVLVMTQPSPSSVGGVDTECTNVPGGPQVNTFWAQDIPRAIEDQYRVTSAAGGWGVIGDSTGGDCALKVTLMNSDKFSVAASLSGGYDAPQDITTGDLYATPQFRDLNNVMWRIEHLPKPPVSVLLTSSRSGESDYAAVTRFQQLTAGTPTHTSTLIRNEGGHNFTTWNAEIPPALQWLTNTLRSPTALPNPGS